MDAKQGQKTSKSSPFDVESWGDLGAPLASPDADRFPYLELAARYETRKPRKERFPEKRYYDIWDRV
ncbi:hypothetical protein CDAR_61241 [Caerostris darwini]|uniref:Uncharacterized protein n=1 Tax=Caerostris darwini TaxID=1538125 RepID=A0AAV4V437_9ARAC|nr:hypothetical protein CDAR_61241 [Caerostris darwini]